MSPLANLIDQSSLTPQRVTALARIVASRQRLNSLAERLNSTRLAVVYVVLARLHRAASQEYQAEQARFDELPSPTGSASILRMTPSVRVRPGAELYEDIARNWVRSSILMKEMLAPRGVPYIHVLQPNQYYTTRAFPPAQAAVARLESSPFKLGAERGYPYLEKAAASDEFKRSGVNVVNAVHVFDREPDPVYIDNCCHYTRRGNELLADVAAKAILGVLAGGFNAAGPGSPRE